MHESAPWFSGAGAHRRPALIIPAAAANQASAQCHGRSPPATTTKLVDRHTCSFPPCRVGRSRTGLGLFATEPIKRGALIAEYTGPRIPTKEARARERENGARYMFEIDSRWTIDGSPRSNIARYANHACKPNAEAIDDDGRILLRARRRIEAGEEITYDYGRAYFTLFFADGRCRCASCAALKRDR